MTSSSNCSSTDNQRLLEAANAAVVCREESLDKETLARLRNIRTAAQTQSIKARRYSLSSLYPYFSLAAASAIVLLVLWWPSPVVDSDYPTELFVGGDWLLDEDMDIEVIEDMEFYHWLAEELDGHSL
ncbi:hypothetical protein ACJJIK_07925 [Microbulbifer sp. ZKSA006]|uniref:hypothetical protein n=1 Tax=Microbulbifer sp. ZKSA006 TaxID=3243390 RepID=UPI0040396679